MPLNPYVRRLSSLALAGSAAAVLLAGCSAPESDAQDKPVVAPEPARVAPAPSSGPATIGGDGSAIVLTPLSQADLAEANLAGELGCSFSTSAPSPILVAMGYAASQDAAQGVVKVGDYVERVAAPGGFDAMIKGVTFSGAGKTVRIDVTGPATGGGESPPMPATLTYDRADGAKLVLPGTWTCGP